MSSAGASPSSSLSLDTGGPWQQRSRQRSRAMVRTYLLSSSVPPLPQAGASRPSKDYLRLPSLAAATAPHRQTTQAPLSISEPSLFTPRERAVFDGFFRNRHPSALRKRPPHPPSLRSSPSPACRACDTATKRHAQNHYQNHQCHYQNHQNHYQNHQCQVPSTTSAYTHFSQPIRPIAKPALVKRYSPILTHTTDQGDLRPLVVQFSHTSSQAGALSVRGKQCLLSNQPSTAAAPTVRARTQLHIFLPTEGAGEGEEMDSESVDEGFMDELDSKITSLKLQQGLQKTVTHPDQ